MLRGRDIVCGDHDKISEDFVHVVTYDAYKPGHLYMNGPEISDILFTKHDRELACEVFLNSIKSKRSPEIMKLVEMS